jgi:hypothetical protein
MKEGKATASRRRPWNGTKILQVVRGEARLGETQAELLDQVIGVACQK